ncbi:hypothetical protein DFH06DRAFT_1093806 [Mycena polygramma]|nr:hypothetical protein DFH06DRAFT_1093806 [Mycena polygramma]
MHTFTSLPLDDDVIDRILGFCPEFDTLLALLSTCKTIHSVFNARPRSITRAVAYNVAGPALADAVRALRPGKDRSTEECLCSPEELLATLGLSPAEKHKLQKNASVVRRFENVFSSFRYKNQMSPTSTLLQEESFRFHRGLYRIILYSETFGPDYYYLKDLERSDYERLDKLQTERKQLLMRYSTEELVEMHAVVCFVTQMLEDVFGPNNMGTRPTIHDCLDINLLFAKIEFNGDSALGPPRQLMPFKRTPGTRSKSVSKSIYGW